MVFYEYWLVWGTFILQAVIYFYMGFLKRLHFIVQGRIFDFLGHKIHGEWGGVLNSRF